MRDLGGTFESQSKFTYSNVKNIGNQLTHSEFGNIFFDGDVSSKQVATYTSKFRTQNINATNQTNLYVSQMTVLENAKVTMETINAGNLDLGFSSPGNLILKENSELNLIANGTSKLAFEAWGTNILNSAGSIILRDNATLNLFPQANSSAISLNSTSAKLEVGRDATIDIQSNGRTSTANNFNTNTIFMAGGANFHVLDGGVVRINEYGQTTSTSNVVHVAGAATL